MNTTSAFFYGFIPPEPPTEPMLPDDEPPPTQPSPTPRRGAWCRRCNNYNEEATPTRTVKARPTYVCLGCKTDGWSVTWGDKEPKEDATRDTDRNSFSDPLLSRIVRDTG